MGFGMMNCLSTVTGGLSWLYHTKDGDDGCMQAN
eukprot:gene40558-36938_t